MHGRALAAALLLLVVSTGAHAAIWERPLGPYGVFRLQLPSAWTAKLQEPDAAGGRAIAITPPTGVPLLLLVSTFPLPDNIADTLLEDGARSMVARLQTIAEEPALEAKWFEGAISRGFYVSATDKRVKEPTAQNFKYGIQGHLVTGRLFATFSVFTNLPSGPERDRALEIVRAAWHEPTTMPVFDNKGTVSLALPDRPWRLLLDLPGFAFEPKQSLPAQQGIRLAGNNAGTGMNVTAFLQAAAPGRSAVDYREQVWARIQPSGPFIDVRRSERDGMALLERTFPGAAGLRIDQRHVNAHVVRDGVWLDVHLSKRAVRCDHPHRSVRQQGDRGRGLRRRRAPPRADHGLGLSRPRRRLFQASRVRQGDRGLHASGRAGAGFRRILQGPRPRAPP